MPVCVCVCVCVCVAAVQLDSELNKNLECKNRYVPISGFHLASLKNIVSIPIIFFALHQLKLQITHINS